MVSRIQNRNQGYSEGLFSQNTNVNIENNSFNSIEGATALKLDENFEVNEQEYNSAINNVESDISEPENNNILKEQENNVPAGVSIESASYLESNSNYPSLEEVENTGTNTDLNNEEEFTPNLFSDESQPQFESNEDEVKDSYTEKLFDQDSHEEEDFEIPAFLRKQKF